MGKVFEETIVPILETLFGGDTPQKILLLHQVAARAIVVYLIGIVIVRCGKSRLIGRTTAVDVLLGFILGSLLSRGITGHASISGTTVSSAAIVVMHFVLTRLAVGNATFETWLKGHAVSLVRDGVWDQDAMLNSHISASDLEEQLRLSGVISVDKVHSARKERNGEVSVISKNVPTIVEVAVMQGVQTVRIEIQNK